MIKRIFYLFWPALLIVGFTGCGRSVKYDDYWLAFADANHDNYGYADQKGKTVIPLGKYTMCFSDTFRTYAIVLKPQSGFVAIDRQENVLYNVFPFDNGPDYVEDGLFRIVEGHKIGFADVKTGAVIIKPQFDCAFPFKNGKAKVSTDCKSQFRGEHQIWISEKWFYIDKSGRIINQP